jgi:hypothetical protein
MTVAVDLELTLRPAAATLRRRAAWCQGARRRSTRGHGPDRAGAPAGPHLDPACGLTLGQMVLVERTGRAIGQARVAAQGANVVLYRLLRHELLVVAGGN